MVFILYFIDFLQIFNRQFIFWLLCPLLKICEQTCSLLVCISLWTKFYLAHQCYVQRPNDIPILIVFKMLFAKLEWVTEIWWQDYFMFKIKVGVWGFCHVYIYSEKSIVGSLCWKWQHFYQALHQLLLAGVRIIILHWAVLLYDIN